MNIYVEICNKAVPFGLFTGAMEKLGMLRHYSGIAARNMLVIKYRELRPASKVKLFEYAA